MIKRKRAVLVVLGMFVLCMVAYALLARPFSSQEPPNTLAEGVERDPTQEENASPTLSLKTENAPGVPDAPSDNPATSSLQASNEQPHMDTLMKEILGGNNSVYAVGDLVTQPERCVFLGAPHYLAYLKDENLILMINRGGIYAFDVASGKQRWHRYLLSDTYSSGAVFGTRQVLGWTAKELFLLDAPTGKEIWSRRETPCGLLQWATISPDETQIFAVCDKGWILYSLDTGGRRVLPKPENAWITGWLPGGKVLLLEIRKKGQEDESINYTRMDIGSGVITAGWESKLSQEDMYPSLSAAGQFAVGEKDGESKTTLKILDALTGNELRAFKDLPGKIQFFFWMKDARRLFYTTDDRKQAILINAETGETLCTLSRAGHHFVQREPFEDASGNAWIFSKDEAKNRYVWPITPDAEPQKVLDAEKIGPGDIELRIGDPCYMLAYNMDEGRLLDITAFTLDGMQKIGQWRYACPKYGWNFQEFNKRLTHCVLSYSVQRNDHYLPKNSVFDVYAQESENPVFTGSGRALAISPNAKFLAVQDSDSTACVYELETETIVSKYGAVSQGDNYISMTAAFSDNGQRMAINVNNTLQIIDLTDGYPQRTATIGTNERFGWKNPCFSPDGSFILCSGQGCAWLFDANTGALLHSFKEPERFAEPYPYRGGFWDSLASTAKDFAGMVSDNFKAGSFVETAFVDAGAQVVTYSAGQLLRVWDSNSGKLLRTIRTGLPEKRNDEGYIINQIVLSANGRFAFCYNANGYGTASLWSLDNGVLQLRYKIPQSLGAEAALSDDGKTFYIKSIENLYQWPGAPAP